MKALKIAPYSRPHTLAKLDRRTREARLMQEVRDSLVAHVGGKPSAVQLQLIERAALLSLHVAMFDAKALEAGGLGERDSRQYLAYSNSLQRCLRELGLKGAAAREPTLAELLAKDRAA